MTAIENRRSPGAEVIERAPRAVLTLEAKYDHLLALQPGETLSDKVGPNTELIPAAVLPALITGLEASLRPALADELQRAVVMIGAAWPNAYNKADGDAMKMFTLMLTEDLAEFPADILRETVKEARRRLKFAPSISELYEIADRLRDRRRWRLSMARAHQREHGRRAAVERAAEERQQEERERFARWHTHLAGVFERELPSAGDLKRADDVVLACTDWCLLDAWRKALNGGERWALEIARRAAAFCPGRDPRRQSQAAKEEMSNSIRKAAAGIDPAESKADAPAAVQQGDDD